MNGIHDPVPNREWLAAWLNRPAFVPNRHSMVIGSHCATHPDHLGAPVCDYLNENDPERRNHWHAFSAEHLWQLAADPACQELIPCRPLPDGCAGPTDSHLYRIVRHLARIGGAVLEGDFCLEATNKLDNVFRVCLCLHRPPCIHSCHMSVNPKLFHGQTLVPVIADSFLDWTSRRPSPHNGTEHHDGALVDHAHA